MKTQNNKRKVELLAPAGNLEKLEIALHYGADAVYLAGKSFSLRNFSGNFTLPQMREAVAKTHRAGVKVYVACNVYSRSSEREEIAEFIRELNKIDIDAIIIADPGIYRLARRIAPEKHIHLSTQANTTNAESVLFWEELGVRRINIARELSLSEIKEITSTSKVEIEAFVHGAMCISYSGRCLLSSFMTKRDSNRGACSHPCRWNYAIVEEKRPGQYLPIEEDERGSYILNSKDLCMLKHIPEMVQAGITSLKIEGRMKGIHYLATTVKTYREAIDFYYSRPEKFELKHEWTAELQHINNRGYCTGFYFGDPEQVVPNFGKVRPSTGYQIVGKVLSESAEGQTLVEVRNKICTGDRVDVFTRFKPSYSDRINAMVDEEGNPKSVAQPGQRVYAVLDRDCRANDLIRKSPGPTDRE